MFNSRRKLLNQRGLTLIELVTASTALIIGLAATEQVRSFIAKQAINSNTDNSILAEHQTLTSLVRSLPFSQVESIVCSYTGSDNKRYILPHPWSKIVSDPDTGGTICKTCPIPGASDCAISPPPPIPWNPIFTEKIWYTLSQAYYDLTLRGKQTGGQLTPINRLPGASSDYLAGVRSGLNALKCLNCHNGVTINPATSKKYPGNFTSLTAVTTDTSPELSLFGLGAPLGRRLLPASLQVSGSLRDPQNTIKSTSQPIVQHDLSFALVTRTLSSTATNLDNSFKALRDYTNQSNLEWNCLAGVPTTTTEIKSSSGCICGPGQVAVECTAVCERYVSGEKKKDVEGCNTYYYYACLKAAPLPPSGRFCQHGNVKPGSEVFPAPYGLKHNRCMSRYPTTFTYYSPSDGKYHTVDYRFSYWECWDGGVQDQVFDPKTTKYDKTLALNLFKAQQQEIQYTIMTTWSKARDFKLEKLRTSTSGVLK